METFLLIAGVFLIWHIFKHKEKQEFKRKQEQKQKREIVLDQERGQEREKKLKLAINREEKKRQEYKKNTLEYIRQSGFIVVDTETTGLVNRSIRHRAINICIVEMNFHYENNQWEYLLLHHYRGQLVQRAKSQYHIVGAKLLRLFEHLHHQVPLRV
jgi:hypothetical protein